VPARDGLLNGGSTMQCFNGGEVAIRATFLDEVKKEMCR
jgi:hypothetical protein